MRGPSRPARVLHLVRPQLFGSIGGVDLHVIELAAAQTQLGGYQPVVVSLGTSPAFHSRASTLGVAIHDTRPHTFVATLRRLVQQDEHGADLVHAHGWHANLVAAWLPRWFRRAFVITWHGATARSLRHSAVGVADRLSMRRAHAVIAVSEPGSRSLRSRMSGVPVYTVPNGVSPPPSRVSRSQRLEIRAELGAVHWGPLVGFVGRFSSEKRPDLFVQAAEQVARMVPATRFVMVGTGPLDASIRRLVSASTVRSALRLVGVRHDMDMVYAALDILVVPSEAEGTPRVVIEAQMRGIPVVATRVGGVPDLVVDGVTGTLVPPDRPEAIAAAVTTLLQSRRLRASLGRAAQTQSAARTTERMALAVGHVYSTCLTGRDQTRAAR